MPRGHLVRDLYMRRNSGSELLDVLFRASGMVKLAWKWWNGHLAEPTGKRGYSCPVCA
jgi:hypothetical protein